MKRFVRYIIVIAIAGCAVGCSDDDEPENFDQFVVDINESEYCEVSSILFDVKPAEGWEYDENAEEEEVELTHKMKYGKCFDKSNPTIYTICANDEAASYRWFIDHCVPMEQREAYEAAGMTEMDFGMYGKIKYDGKGGSHGVGRIEVSLPEIDALSAIDFIPQNAWPLQASSPFKPGALVYNTSNGLYYLCVTACSTEQGVLISFDSKCADLDRTWSSSGKHQRYESSNAYRFKDHYKTTEIHKGPTQDQWNALAYFAANSANLKGNLENLYNKMSADKQVSVKWLIEAPALIALYGGDNYGCVEYDSTLSSADYNYWWQKARHYWKVKQIFVSVRKDNIVKNNLGLYVFNFYVNTVADKKSNYYPSRNSAAHAISFGFDSYSYLQWVAGAK